MFTTGPNIKFFKVMKKNEVKAHIDGPQKNLHNVKRATENYGQKVKFIAVASFQCALVMILYILLP